MIFFTKVERVAKSICMKFVLHGQIEKRAYYLYVFGLREQMISCINLAIALLIGGVFGQFWENVIFLICYWLLRRYAGGYHAHTRERCFVYSLLLIVGVMVMLMKIDTSLNGSMFLLLASLSIIWNISPIESVKREMVSDQRILFRNMSRIISGMGTLVSIVVYQMGYCKAAQSIMWGIISVALSQMIAYVVGIYAGSTREVNKGEYR